MCLSEERMWEPLSSGGSRSPFPDVEQKVKMTPHWLAEFKGGFNAMDISNASLVGKKKKEEEEDILANSQGVLKLQL